MEPGSALGRAMWTLPIEKLQVFEYTVNTPDLPTLCPNWASYYNHLKELCQQAEVEARPMQVSAAPAQPEEAKLQTPPARVEAPKPAVWLAQPKVSEWMCVCGRKNNGLAKLCITCSQPKLAVKPPEEAKVEPVGESWDCPSCTFKGVRGLKCQICGSLRPQPRSRPQPAAADIPASDLKVKCTACGAKGQQACICSQRFPCQVVPAKANSSGTQWKCEKCEYPSNMFTATRCFKCKARKAE